MAPKYGEQSYWDTRYTSSPLAFDWYQGYAELKPLLNQYVDRTQHVLQVGVGTSLLQLDMARDGYRHVVNTDFSCVCIAHMQQKHKHVAGLSYVVSDCRHMPEFANNSFHAVVDKGTLDAVMCSSNSFEDAYLMLNEVYRVLSPGGVFLEVTYGSPSTRLNHLSAGRDWQVELYTIDKSERQQQTQPGQQQRPALRIEGPLLCTGQGDVSGILAALSNREDVHYVYVCKKLASEASDSASSDCSTDTREEGVQQDTGVVGKEQVATNVQ